MSDDILMYARREAARIREMQKRSFDRTVPYPAAARCRAPSTSALLDVRPRSASTAAEPKRAKSVTIGRPQSAMLSNKKSTISFKRYGLDFRVVFGLDFLKF